MKTSQDKAVISQKLSPSQAQRQRLSAYQRQSLKVLCLSAPELNDLIAKTALENPLLEVDWGGHPLSPPGAAWDIPAREERLRQDIRLEYHIACQDPALLPLGDYLIAHLDESGYLRLPLKQVAARLGQSLDAAKQALRLLQTLDPPGVGARSLQESLFLQLKRQSGHTRLAQSIVLHHLEQLAQGDISGIALALGCSQAAAEAAADQIRALRPRPFQGLVEEAVRYAVPELAVAVSAGEVSVSLIPRTPSLRILPYQTMLAGDEAALTWAQGQAREVRQLAEAIQRRQRTLLAIGRQIAAVQRAFFLKGSPLCPLTQQALARELSLSVSTISRAASGQYLSHQGRIYPLRHFFEPCAASGASRAQICALMRTVISGEQPGHPVSDGQLARLLASMNQPISRRLITKYRQAMGIPKADDRRRI